MLQCCPALTKRKWYVGTSILLHPTALLLCMSGKGRRKYREHREMIGFNGIPCCSLLAHVSKQNIL